MKEIMAIANSLAKRILGVKVVYFLVFTAILLIMITNLYDILMIHESRALTVDAAMMLITAAAFLSVLTLAFDIPKELNSGVATVLLSKPLGRTHYLFGKLIGASMVGMLFCSIISIGFLVIHSWFYEQPTLELALACLLIVSSRRLQTFVKVQRMN